MVNFPLVNAPAGQYTHRCIYSGLPIEPGQLVALSPLGLIKLVAIPSKKGNEPLPAEVLAYGTAVVSAYGQRQGWLLPDPDALQRMSEQIFAHLQSTIPVGQCRYVHQLLQQVDIVPWLTSLLATP